MRSKYEYKSVVYDKLNEHYAEGWEPVPNVPVIRDARSFPWEYLQLRRERVDSERWQDVDAERPILSGLS